MRGASGRRCNVYALRPCFPQDDDVERNLGVSHTVAHLKQIGRCAQLGSQRDDDTPRN